ncbi:MAG: hypothetical protein Q7U38_18595 [Methylobacter sp.]|nr:hypothetical protein [Methylobacter sp.]MDP2430351.1 hypothetical protein [Methylobacter sp.]MDZ4217722.1 hypothetical protein [Methylobacter sp.]
MPFQNFNPIVCVYRVSTSGGNRVVNTKIQKSGNGLALRVSGVLRDIPHFESGDEVQIEVNEEGFVVKKVKPLRKTMPFTEE